MQTCVLYVHTNKLHSSDATVCSLLVTVKGRRESEGEEKSWRGGEGGGGGGGKRGRKTDSKTKIVTERDRQTERGKTETDRQTDGQRLLTHVDKYKQTYFRTMCGKTI